MKGTEDFHKAARLCYMQNFGSESERVKRYGALLKAEEAGNYDKVDELREAESEDVLCVEQLTHSLRGNCEWEILLTTGGPAARVVAEVDIDGQVRYATFQYQDWFQPWYAPEGQYHTLLTEWAAANFMMECPYCREDNCR
jgi:hypothetical protein